jgi:general secretion pathway protein B
MSFILDALRKSEHARQKQTGPGLAEVPVAPARPRTNVWAGVAVALLIVNLVAVGVLLLRRAGREDTAAVTPAAATAPGAPQATPAETTATPPAASPSAATGPTLAPVASAPVTQAPSSRPPPADGRNPLAAEVGETQAEVDPALARAAASVPGGPPAVTRQAATAPTKRGSVVYAPIPEAGDEPYSPPPAANAPAPAPATPSMPTADEVTARGGVPELHLDLHVYSNQPQQRFIFVNARKYREGDTLQEGPVVEQITPDGAVLNYRGSRFKLTHN